MVQDQQYFNTVDTPDKAYWLGFIAADGSVHQNGQLLQINLKESDIDHLEKFKKVIDADNEIYPMNGRAVRLSLYCPQMIEGLKFQGIGPAKSLTLKPSNLLALELQRHYWRGMVDGDGSICKKRAKRKNGGYRKVWCISLNGTLEVVTAFREFLLTNLDVCSGSIEPHSSIWKASWAGTRACRKIANFLYSGYNTTWSSLDRKQKLADELRNQPEYSRWNPSC